MWHRKIVVGKEQEELRDAWATFTHLASGSRDGESVLLKSEPIVEKISFVQATAKQSAITARHSVTPLTPYHPS